MIFSIKKISFLGRESSILCQNENGPCPLIALANIMSLQNRIVFPLDLGYICIDDLVQLMANLLLESTNSMRTTVHRASQIDSTLYLLPKLARGMIVSYITIITHMRNELGVYLFCNSTGLDLNVCFKDVDAFEFTEV